MTIAPLAQPNALACQASSRPGPMRPPSLSSSHAPPSEGATTAATGPDVTSTSPSASSLVSIRPLPSPSLYQPASDSAPKRAPSISTTNVASYVPPPLSLSVAQAAPLSSDSSVSSFGEASSSSAPMTMTMTIKHKENTGRWLTEEHEVFLQGLDEHGKQWKKIAIMIQTRSVVQVRTHAQKYFQKLLKKEDGRPGKERTSSIISTSTAVSAASLAAAAAAAPAAVKRKSSKGNKAGSTKKRRVSLEPKPKKYQHLSTVTQYQYQPPLVPVADLDHTVIDPSFMNTLANMEGGDLEDSLLDLLDDASVDAVEQVIGDMEPNPVSPSVSSGSLAGANGNLTRTVSVADHSIPSRQEMVTSPNPTEDFSIHQTIGTTSVSGRELSPTSVACMMDIKDFEQKTSGNYVDALDWLMDDGWQQLPASSGEAEPQEDWSGTYPTAAAALALPLSANNDGVF